MTSKISANSNGASQIDYASLAYELGYLMRRAQLWIFQDFIKTLAPVNIRPAQYSVMIIAEANPGLPQISLACALGIERARLVRLLDQLEERDLIERRQAEGDRRSHALFLTDHGAELLLTIKGMLKEHHKRCLKIFGGSKNQEQLVSLLAHFGSSQADCL